ncbi:autotransporter domain-containing protein [Xenorhabdus bovienii]|uniref:autotransporter domain-containing protein n=1 Tax=Xenorhabdus bovienii TaxID=40576 RepID=UPI0023B2237D|nr:autotransporter domain-containing protein [Xenorhabdus bovienii]MDE9544147.1 autotransporter domain-containing protein [Xenorhabdus bovienii]
MKRKMNLLSVLVFSAIYSGEILAEECRQKINSHNNSHCIVTDVSGGKFFSGYSNGTNGKTGVSKNSLTMENILSSGDFILHGGETPAFHGDNFIEKNKVIISDSEIGGLNSSGAYVYAGSGAKVKENTVSLKNVVVKGKSDISGTFTIGTADTQINDSSVIVNNSHFMNEAIMYGVQVGEGKKDTAVLKNNLVKIDNSKFEKYALLVGGTAGNISNATLVENRVNINNSIFDDYVRIYGVMNLASNGNNENNSVSIEKSNFNYFVDITGLFSSMTEAYTPVFVYLKDVVFNSKVNILGIKTSHSQDISGVDITLDGHIEFNAPEHATILSGKNFGDRDRLTGNILNFRADPLKLKSVSGFESYKFFLNENIKDGDILLNTIDAIDVNKSTVTVDGIHKDSELVKGGYAILMSNVIGDSKLINSETTLGTAKLLSFGLEKKKTENGKDLIIVNVTPFVLEPKPEPIPEPIPEPKPEPIPESKPELNPQTLAYLSGRNAGMLSVNNGLIKKINLKGDYIESFALVESGKNRFNIGKKLDLRASHFLVGNSIYSENLDSSIGLFFETGSSSYISHNESRLPTVKGKGNVNYRGGGIVLQKKGLNENIRVTTSLRGGKLNYDFKTNDFGINKNITSHYNSDSMYWGAHIGIDKKINIDNDKSVTIRGIYQYTHVGKDEINTKSPIGEEMIKFNSVNSYQTKLDATLNVSIDEDVTLNTGLGYQYEFDGKTKGSIEGISMQDISSTGGSGFASFGIEFGEKSNFSGEMKLTGYVGDKQGVEGLLNIKYRF